MFKKLNYTIPYGRQYIDNSDINSIVKAAQQDLITTGKSVISFEKKLCKLLNVNHSVACSSGTSAIHLALIAINTKKNDIIIMPAINFVSSYSMCHFMGAKIFLADVDSLSGQMTPKTLNDCIKKNNLKKIKAVITMYMGGYPENVLEFYKIKKKYNFLIIEDACHAFGSKYKFKKKFYYIGSCKHSDISTFSLHPLKTFTTGEGGLLTTNNYLYYKRIIQSRSHGIIRNKKYHWKYDIKNFGFNYRLSDINCALGVSQLKKVNMFIKDKKRIYLTYKKELNKFDKFIKLVEHNKNTKPSYHLVLVNINFNKLKFTKDNLLNYLMRNKILSQYHYIPVYLFSAFQKKIQKFPGSDKYYKNSLSLPIYYGLKTSIIKRIIFKLTKYLNL